MESLYLLIPISIIIVFLIFIFLFWSFKNEQFDDLKGPGHRVIMDDDTDYLNDIKSDSKK